MIPEAQIKYWKAAYFSEKSAHRNTALSCGKIITRQAGQIELQSKTIGRIQRVLKEATK